MNKKDLQLPSQLLLRNIEQIQGNNVVVFNAPDVEVCTMLAEQLPNAAVHYFFFNYHDYLQTQLFLQAHDIEAQCVFQPWYTPQNLHDSVIIFLPKSRALIDMTLAMAGQALEAQAVAYVIGEKNSGIRSSVELIEQHIGRVTASEPARHCVMISAQKQTAQNAKSLNDYVLSYEFLIQGKTLTIKSLPGVFSHGRIDEGTELFLKHLGPLQGDILDLGCGSGIIGTAIKVLFPETNVTMTDADALALAATELTVASNNISAIVKPSDVFSELTEDYNTIVSNPPFHHGIATNYTIVENFFRQAKQHLKPHGTMRIVANIFLPYRRLITKYFENCTIIAETKRYRIYETQAMQPKKFDKNFTRHVESPL